MFMSLVVVASAIWMAVDSSQIGYDKRDIRGMAAMSPAGWFIGGLFLWIIFFPYYLARRGELKAAAEQRRALTAAGMPPHMPLPPAGQAYGAPPMGTPPGYAPPMYGQPPAPGPYGQAPMPGPYGQAPMPGPYGQAPMPGQSPMPGPYGQSPMPGQPPVPGPSPAGYGGPAPGQPPAALSVEEVGDQLAKLEELRQSGILTDAEFKQQKDQLLARM